MGEAFLSWIVTADETWVHHFEQDKEWYRRGRHTLVSRLHQAVKVDRDFVEK
jgi:hypothetical protein